MESRLIWTMIGIVATTASEHRQGFRVGTSALDVHERANSFTVNGGVCKKLHTRGDSV